MPSLAAILTFTSLSLLASPSPLPLLRRDAALRDSPSGQYAPSVGVCPANLAVRRPSTEAPLNGDEAAYIQAKTASSVTEWSSYLTTLGLADLNVATFVPARENAVPGVTVPKIGFVISGGGSRSMLVGGGMMAALDGRSPEAVAAKTGGILQLAQYMVGLSGGSWMTGSWALANFPLFGPLRDEVWDLENSLLGPESENPEQYADAVYATTTKRVVAPVSVVDAYGRLLSYHLVNDTNNPFGPGSATLWSSIRDQPAFLSASVPLPIIVAVGRADSEERLSLSSPIYEFSPFEFGTTDPSLAPGAFIPIDFFGSSFENGEAGASCLTGFENAGFLMGTSGNIFGLLGDDPELAPEGQENLLTNAGIVSAVGGVADVASATRVDNAFLGLNAETFLASSDEILNLVDGGLTNENIPFFPLLNPARGLDVIITADASADNNSFPDGSSLYNSYQKSLLPGYDSLPFPLIPAQDAFVAAGLNQRPVFFGSSCTGGPTTPLIVYLPNYNINYATNTSTLQDSYPVEEQAAFFSNSFAIATQESDEGWAKCFGCALVDSQVARNGGARSGECEACFTRYCFV